MAETDLLPEDVIVNILCWLPVIALIRFTPVSKRWRFIILSDPKFTASHFNAARQRKTLGSSRVLLSTGAPQLESHDTTSFGSPSSFARKLGLPFEQRGGRDVTLLGSCNGLVFVAFSDSYFYIWNPVTRFFMELPGPGFPGGGLRYYGAGYLSATDDYRVVASSSQLQAELDEYEDDIYCLGRVDMKMFSSKAKVWKTIQPYGPYRDGTIYPFRGTLLSEALHWVHRDEILAFDLAPEEFRTMGLPGDQQYRNHVKFRYVGCSELEGSLCVCGYMSGFQGFMDFWIMREYGVHDSWTKLFQFFYTPANPYSRSIVTISCRVVIRGEGDMDPHWLLVKIDHKQEEQSGVYMLQRINRDRCLSMLQRISKDHCLTIIPYEESLLRIND